MVRDTHESKARMPSGTPTWFPSSGATIHLGSTQLPGRCGRSCAAHLTLSLRLGQRCKPNANLDICANGSRLRRLRAQKRPLVTPLFALSCIIPAEVSATPLVRQTVGEEAEASAFCCDSNVIDASGRMQGPECNVARKLAGFCRDDLRRPTHLLGVVTGDLKFGHRQLTFLRLAAKVLLQPGDRQRDQRVKRVAHCLM
jgi:hypothetical protein